MGPGRAAEGETNLELAHRLIPPTGNNWGEVAKRGAAEAEFLDRVRPLVHPDFETLWRHSALPGETRAGLNATLAALRSIGEAFDELIALPEVYVDLGDRVLILLTRKGRTVTGDDFAEEGAAMYIFEARQLRRLELYSDRAIALADAGITEAEARERGVPVEDIA